MRIASIDLFRAIAIFGVIIIHVNPFAYSLFGGGPLHVVEVVLSRAGRIGVPYFFLIAGYFYGRRLRQGDDPIRLFARYARRLLGLFLAWSVFYLVVPIRPVKLLHEGYAALEMHKLRWCAEHPYLLLVQGTKPHLWFLPALVCALGIVGACHYWNARKTLGVVAVVLYVIGLLTGPYAYTPIGLNTFLDPRNGPFFSTFFVYLGWLLTTMPRWLSTRVAWLLMIAGGLGFGLELSAIQAVSGKLPKIADLGVFLVPYAVGFAALALRNPDWGARTVWPRVGRYVLGIYVVHIVFVGWLWPLRLALHNPVFELVFPCLVFGLALAATVFLARYKRLRPLVV